MADTLRLRVAVPPSPGHKNAVVALDLNGTCEYADFMASKALRSNKSDAAKVAQMLKTLATHGGQAYKADTSQLRDVGDGLQELKPKQQRLLVFLAGVTWVIVSARPKPVGQKKVQDAWIVEGKRRKALYLLHLSKGTLKTI